MPVETGKEKFFTRLETLIAEAKRLKVSGFGDQEPEEATKQLLLEPLFHALGFAEKSHSVREFKILGDSVDYLLKSERPLIFVEAKSLHDCPKASLFDKHREQVLRYIQNYRLSPEITKMDQPVAWILLTNFDQLHLVRVNETAPTFSFKLDELWPKREELWELLALENLEANRIDEIYNQRHKASLDQLFLADLKRWRLLIANGFALRNQKRSLEELTLASQQLLDRFIFCRMLETRRLVEYNKLARAYNTYEVLYGRADKNFSEVVRESLFIEIKNDFNTELFEQPLLCDQLELDNLALAAVVGHEPLAPELAATCGFESGQGELLAFRHLYSYDFSLMSQDVMGAVYERFLAHKLEQKGGRIVIEDTDELRKKEGIYYTPKYIVDYIVGHTLGEKIKPILAEAKTLLGYKNFKGASAKIRELSQVKVLDPAMGSGSFLLVAFDALVNAYADYNAECRLIKKDRNGHGSLFDADFSLAEEVFDAPLHVLTENIFGVDLDKQAVEVAKLNLWLRYMAVNRDSFLDRLRNKQRGGKPLNLLPNLTSNLKCGNSLIADKSVAGNTAFVWEKEFPEIMGGTGGSPVPSGNLPDGTERTTDSSSAAGLPADAPGATYSKRNLPHFEKPWAIYHVIINTIAPRKLSPAARDVVFDCVLHWRESRYRLVAASVMPDHAHFIIQPGVKEEDQEGNPIFWPLSEILHSIKSYSAKEVNKLDQVKGTLWQEERYDRYMRSDADLQEKFHYVCRNPWAAGLVQENEPWPWLWTPEIEAWQPYVPLSARKGSTGDSPVPVGDPPAGMGETSALPSNAGLQKGASLPSAGLVARRHGPVARATRRGFDVVIGNPPYERIQTMQAYAPESVEFLKANYRSAASGNFDIYVCFIEHGLQLLNASGVFGYICPNKFFQSEYGVETRGLLSEGKHVSRLVNFGHLQIFSQATIYTCLLFLRKQPQTEFPYFKVEDLEKWQAGNGTLPIPVTADSLNHKEWNFVPSANQPLFRKINSLPHKLEEVADIFVGLQTSADEVFILDYLGDTKSTIRLQSKSLGTEWTFEKELLHPLVSGTDVPAHGPLPHRQFIIFPYKVKGDKAELIEFSEIQKKFPKTAEYLSKNQTTLENREGGKFKDEEWHRFGRLQNLTRQAIPKLCVPRLVDQLHAAWDENGEVFLDNVDVGGVTVKPEFDGLKMPYLLALLNSKVLRWFFPFVSVPFRGNYFSANRQFLGQLPIKLIDPKKKNEAKLEKEVIEYVERIQAAHRQRTKLPEVLSRLIAHTQSRTPCNLAHYLQKDFAAAVKPEILIDDVQRTGFIHAIQIEAEGSTGHRPVPAGDPPDGMASAHQGKKGAVIESASPAIPSGHWPDGAGGAPALPTITLTATVSADGQAAPRPLPVLRLAFKDEALQHFIYASWRQFLADHSRQKRWTKGKKPEAVYPLLVNALEPLVCFSSGAGDNLRAIRDLMQAVAAEAGSSDLAAIEAEIKTLDTKIDAQVYELYDLTEAEIKIVEGRSSAP